MVTSRDALAGLVAREGAQRIEVDLLPPEDAVSLLNTLIGDRVDAEPEAAAALAAGCGWLPLALRIAAELAASRPTTSLTDLVAELWPRTAAGWPGSTPVGIRVPRSRRCSPGRCGT